MYRNDRKKRRENMADFYFGRQLEEFFVSYVCEMENIGLEITTGKPACSVERSTNICANIKLFSLHVNRMYPYFGLRLTSNVSRHLILNC